MADMLYMLDQMEQGISTLLQQLSRKRAVSAAYRARAGEDEYQAALVAAQAQKQNQYLLQSAAEKARTAYQQYLQSTAARQVQTAAAGLRNDSATVQYMLKNSRFQALLEEQTLAHDLQTSVEENNEQSLQQIRALKASALANRRAANKSSSGFSISSALINFLGGY